jgi:thiamine-monophosphate kinase
MDENKFIEWLKKEFPFSRGTGIGDDSSVVKSGNGFQLITTDILTEGIHFDRSYFTPEEIALKSLAVNISDIAAMGGTSEYFYLGLGFPADFSTDNIENFFQGIKNGCEKWQIELAGGDLSSSPSHLFISITMIGSSDKPVSRDGALAGDLIGLSRVTGESFIGLELLKRGIDHPYYSTCHRVVEPEAVKGPLFSEYASSMIDISDGLLMDLERILKASGKGAEVIYEKIPVTEQMRAICDKYHIDEQGAVLGGGEDFALLFTVPPEYEVKLREKNSEYYIVGKITEGKELNVIRDGRPVNVKRMGYDHFINH